MQDNNMLENIISEEQTATEPVAVEEENQAINKEQSIENEQIVETGEPATMVEKVTEAQANEEATATATAEPEQTAEEAAETLEQPAQTEAAEKKQPFKLTAPINNEELLANMCTKRGRKLIFSPKEVIYEASFTVLGTDKKNEEGIRVKDILEAEIKEGTRLGYIDKYDGLKSSEIKEEYEDDIIYEYAEQEFKKMGVIYESGKLKVYVYDWDGKACHHVGFIDETEAAESIKYFSDKENYSFALCGIITGGKGKRVSKDENGKITITKEKGGNYGIELDVTIIARKD